MVEVKSRSGRPHDASSFGWRPPISGLHGHRITYLLASGITALIYYGLLGLGLLVSDDRVPYLFLAVVSHLATVVIVYPCYRRAVFHASRGSWIRGFLRFYAVGLGFLATSLVGLPILIELVGLPIMVAQGIIIAASPSLTYVIHRKWTFRDR